MLALTAASGDVCQMWLKTVVMNFGSWSSACLRDAYADSALGDVRESVCDEFWSWSSVRLYDSCADSASGDVCLMWIRTTAVNFGDGALYVCVMPVLTVFVCLCDACADSTFGDACTGWMKTTALRCGVRTVCVLCVVCPD